jgi:hypothetical protein
VRGRGSRWQLRLEAARSLALGENHCGGQITVMMANMLPIQTQLHSDAIMVYRTALRPLLSSSGGSMHDTDNAVCYACGCPVHR